MEQGDIENFWGKLKLEEDKSAPKQVNTTAVKVAVKNLPLTQNSIPQKSKKKGEYRYEKLQRQVDPEIRIKWEAVQNKLKKKLIEHDDFEWTIDSQDPQKTTLKYIGGLDISYSKYNSRKAVAALIICEYPSMKVIYEDFEVETAEYPYIPGFLAFKEVPAYSILFDRLKKKKLELWPQVILVDGNGILHTRSFGCASQCGVLFNVPSIGVGKTVFAVDGLTQENVKDKCDQKLLKGGNIVQLVGRSKKVWGAALKSTDYSNDPIIISQGHRISLQTSIKVVKACISKFRIPEPIRQADLKSRELVKKYYDGDKDNSSHKSKAYDYDDYDDYDNEEEKE